MKKVKGSVCAPEGFLSSGISCGLKRSGKKDLAIIFSKVPATASGLFTTNSVKAAPVIVTSKQIKSGIARAIIVNSGSANCCTGAKGLKDAEKMIELTASALKIAKKRVLVSSTGSIGKPLPIKKIANGIKKASGLLSKDSKGAAQAILTTDTRTKEIAVKISIGKNTVTIGGMAKGSGMINPKMATMLSFVTTDAKIKPALLRKLLTFAVNNSFNMTTVDRDRSTNDMVLVLANGLSGIEIKEGSSVYKKFAEALQYVCTHLAKEIARDGEGATKLIEVKVQGAKTGADARRAAKIIVGSNLFKAAVFGEDPNWGRVMAALGYSGTFVDPSKVSVSIGKSKLVSRGKGVKFNSKAKQELKKKEVKFLVDLRLGKGSATAWGCDLTYDYVKINAKYRT